MANFLKRIVIRGSFETLVKDLSDALIREGFVVSGVADFQHDLLAALNVHFGKYVVILAHVPQLSYQLLTVSRISAVILPCNIAVIERHPGEVEVIPVNPTGLMVHDAESASVKSLSMEVSRKVERAIHSLYRDSTNVPDLITSWE